PNGSAGSSSNWAGGRHPAFESAAAGNSVGISGNSTDVDGGSGGGGSGVGNGVGTDVGNGGGRGGGVRGIYRRGTSSFRNQISKFVRKESSNTVPGVSASSFPTDPPPMAAATPPAASAVKPLRDVTSATFEVAAATAAAAA
ncbi:unnamed protein product, partial [Pylaiella littoralis]